MSDPSLVVADSSGHGAAVFEELAPTVRKRIADLASIDRRRRFYFGDYQLLRYAEGDQCQLFTRVYSGVGYRELPTSVTVLAIRAAAARNAVPFVNEMAKSTQDHMRFSIGFVRLATESNSSQRAEWLVDIEVDYDSRVGQATSREGRATDDTACPGAVIAVDSAADSLDRILSAEGATRSTTR